MAGVEGGRENGLSPDLDGACIYKYAFMFSQVSFVNFFPAPEPRPLPRHYYLGPSWPLTPGAHSKAGGEGARGGLRLSAEPSQRRAAAWPVPRLEQPEVPILKRPLPPGAQLRAWVLAAFASASHPPTPRGGVGEKSFEALSSLP